MILSRVLFFSPHPHGSNVRDSGVRWAATDTDEPHAIILRAKIASELLFSFLPFSRTLTSRPHSYQYDVELSVCVEALYDGTDRR